jgi:hypothetical protein
MLVLTSTVASNSHVEIVKYLINKNYSITILVNINPLKTKRICFI